MPARGRCVMNDEEEQAASGSSAPPWLSSTGTHRLLISLSLSRSRSLYSTAIISTVTTAVTSSIVTSPLNLIIFVGDTSPWRTIKIIINTALLLFVCVQVSAREHRLAGGGPKVLSCCAERTRWKKPPPTCELLMKFIPTPSARLQSRPCAPFVA